MILETSDGITLSYDTYGDPQHPALLLLHGLGADHEMWQPQIATYPNQDLFLIVPDLRGHGASSVPGTFSLQDCARDMYDLVQCLVSHRTNVIGVSMGGLIAQQFACDYPEEVEKLIIADSFSGISTRMERFNARLASFLLAVLPTGLQSRLLVQTYTKMGQPAVAAYFEKLLPRLNPATLRQMRRTVNNFDILDRLGELQAPTLVLVGDGFGKTAIAMARRTADAIPGAAFKVLEGGGDPSNLLVPDAFDREVLGFLEPPPDQE